MCGYEPVGDKYLNKEFAKVVIEKSGYSMLDIFARRLNLPLPNLGSENLVW